MLELDTFGDVFFQSKPSKRTLGQQLDSRLARLLGALGQSEHLEHALRTVELLTGSWRDQLVSAGPRWSSDITDDHSPFEFSLALGGASQVLRVLTEPQDLEQPSLRASWRLAADIHEELASKGSAGFIGYDKVSALFEPKDSDQGAFSIWHSAILAGAKKANFKVYLNPAIHGTADAARLVSEALARLGLGAAWQALEKTVLARTGLDQVIYFSLDLTDDADARAKVYVAHHHGTASDVARVLSQCPGFAAEDVGRWFQHLLGSQGPFPARPPITCFALRRAAHDLHTTTLHLPVRCYAPDDFDIARRICTLLSFPRRVSYMRALTEFAERPLQNGSGIQTYASLRASPGREAVTVYLAPQVYSSMDMLKEEAGVGLLGYSREHRSSRQTEHRGAT
jgi:hypothetical protein